MGYALNVAAVTVISLGFLLAVLAHNFKGLSYIGKHDHQGFGWIVFLLVVVQTILGIRRPHKNEKLQHQIRSSINRIASNSMPDHGKGEDQDYQDTNFAYQVASGLHKNEQTAKTMPRSVWEWGHRLLGLTVVGLGLYTAYLGIGKYKLFYGSHTWMGTFVWIVVVMVYTMVMGVVVYVKSKHFRQVIWNTFHKSDGTEGDSLMKGEDRNLGSLFFKKAAKFANHPSTTTPQRNLLARRPSFDEHEYDAGIHAALAEAQDWQQKQDGRRERRKARRTTRRSKRRTGKRKKKDNTANPNPDGISDDASNDGFSSDDGMDFSSTHSYSSDDGVFSSSDDGGFISDAGDDGFA